MAGDENSEEASREQATQGVVIRIDDSEFFPPASPVRSQELG